MEPIRKINELPTIEEYDKLPWEFRKPLKVTSEEYKLMADDHFRRYNIDMNKILSEYSGKRLPDSWIGPEWYDEKKDTEYEK